MRNKIVRRGLCRDALASRFYPALPASVFYDLFATQMSSSEARVEARDDAAPMSKLMLSVMGAFAEFERALIKERQREGIAIAKRKGLYRGRKKALSQDQQHDLRARVAQGAQKSDLAREFNISRVTLYKYLRG